MIVVENIFQVSMWYLIYKILLLHSKMSFSYEHWMVEVMNMYLTFQMHKNDEITFNPNSEEARYYIFLNLEFTLFVVVRSCIDF